MNNPTLKQLRQEVRRADPDLDADDPAFGSALILLALAFKRPATIRNLADFLDMDATFVGDRLARLRANGVLRGWGESAMLYHSGWDDEDTGGIAFWLDVSIAEGMLERTA